MAKTRLKRTPLLQAIKALNKLLTIKTPKKMKTIELNEMQALQIVHMIEHEVKNILRDKNSTSSYKDCALKEMRILHEKITNTFNDLY